MRDPVEEKKHFDRLAETTGEIWWGSKTPAGIVRLERRAGLVTEKLKTLKQPAVLELGCGVGAFSACLLERRPTMHLTGIDVSPKSVRRASSRLKFFKNASFKTMDATRLTFKGGRFEAVIGNSVLHHLPLLASLREVFRVLKSGGFIWFSEPNMVNPEIAIEKNIPFIGKILQNSRGETAFFRWSLADTLCNIGFQQVSVRPFDFLHPLTPPLLVGTLNKFGMFLERVPVIKEIAGSLLIYGKKP